MSGHEMKYFIFVFKICYIIGTGRRVSGSHIGDGAFLETLWSWNLNGSLRCATASHDAVLISMTYYPSLSLYLSYLPIE